MVLNNLQMYTKILNQMQLGAVFTNLFLFNPNRSLVFLNVVNVFWGWF